MKKTRKKFIEFTRNIWILDVTEDEVGSKINYILGKTFELDRLYIEIKTKYDVLYKESNIEKLNSIIRKCEDKIIEIKDIIKDFDYSDKKTYEELTSKVENDLKELENIKNVNKINKIIDEINKIYRNAYNKKNNVSSLSYIMETDENIDLIKKIDIENLE